MDALTAIATRHSTRSFTSKPLSRADLESIVNAGRAAPSARNEQPWEFVVVADAATRRRIAELTEGGGSFIAEAPACIAIFSKPTKYYLEDGCLAAGSMLIAATALGIQSCWVAGDKKPYADAIKNLLFAPDDYKLVAMIALGYSDAQPQISTKRPLNEVLHWERF
ncbi:MAG: nitroreductase family protein [Myxococcales bacterium]|jgi:nitroreductase